MAFAYKEWHGIRIDKIDKACLKQFSIYGLPLTASFALTYIVSTSDRFLLSWYLGAASSGLYAAGYDLAQQSLGMLMVVVNLASYPLVVRALETHGFEAAREQLRKQLALLLAIAIPSSVGLAICSQNIAEVILGEAFRASATMIIPWVSVTALIAGIKAFYLDLSFQLGHRTQGQVYIMLICALINVAINVILIPVLGLKGALIGSALSYIVGFMLSLIYGRRIFRLPPAPSGDTSKICLATFCMAASLMPIIQYRGKTALVMQLFTGICVYICSCVLLDVINLRKKLLIYIKYPTC